MRGRGMSTTVIGVGDRRKKETQRKKETLYRRKRETLYLHRETLLCATT
jgi:hypothetical protein